MKLIKNVNERLRKKNIIENQAIILLSKYCATGYANIFVGKIMPG